MRTGQTRFCLSRVKRNFAIPAELAMANTAVV